MSVSYNLVQIVKDTFGVDEIKAKAFAEAVVAEHSSATATKDDLKPIEKSINDMKVDMAELRAESKWITRAALYLCVLTTGAAIKYFFHL